MKSIKTILPLAAFAGLALSANAAVTVITPVSEEATAQFGDFVNTIDGAGLSGGGTSGDILSETNVGGSGTFALFPGGPDFTGDSVTFTLAEASTVDRVHLWVYNNGTWGTITGFDLEFSTDNGSTFPTIATGITFNIAELTNVQTKTFAQQTGVTDIRLSNVVVTGGNTAYAGLDEIRFGGDQAAIPEPTTTALLGLGGLALIMRRRK